MGRPAQCGTTLVLAPPPLGHGMVPPSKNTVGRTSILGTGHLVHALSSTSRQQTPTTVYPSYRAPLLGGGTCPGTWWCGSLGHGLACGSRLSCDFGSSCTTTTGITTQCHCLESNNQFVLVVVVVIVISSPTATTTTTPLCGSLGKLQSESLPVASRYYHHTVGLVSHGGSGQSPRLGPPLFQDWLCLCRQFKRRCGCVESFPLLWHDFGPVFTTRLATSPAHCQTLHTIIDSS